MDAVSKMTPLERTETALRLAENHFGVEPLLSPKGSLNRTVVREFK